jgi:hypothetical protein
VIEGLASGGIGTGQGQDVVLHLVDQGAHVVGEAQGARLLDTGAGESLGQATALAVVFGLVHLLFQRIALGDGRLGTPFQGGAQAGERLQAVKASPSPGPLGQASA